MNLLVIVLHVLGTMGSTVNITDSLHVPFLDPYFIRPMLLQKDFTFLFSTSHTNNTISLLKDCLYYACLNFNKLQCFHSTTCFDLKLLCHPIQ